MSEQFSYVIFDRETGRILGSHQALDPDGNWMPLSDQDVLTSFGLPDDPQTRRKVDVVRVDRYGSSRSHQGYRVDVGRRELAARKRLEVVPATAQLKGDGKSSVELKIQVFDANGKLDEHFSGKVKVTTDRGRLSTEAGVVDVRKGSATISLTSVPETIERVRIRARDIAGDCGMGTAEVEFT